MVEGRGAETLEAFAQALVAHGGKAELAQSIQQHWSGVLAFLKTRLTNGAIEAVNGLLQLAKRLARGFRSLRYFRIMAYLKAAGLHLDAASQAVPCYPLKIANDQKSTDPRRVSSGLHNPQRSRIGARQFRKLVALIVQRALYKIFQIPLDLSMQTVLRATPFIRDRQRFGHIHYFTKETALQLLSDLGYNIIDWFYTAVALDLDRQRFHSLTSGVSVNSLKPKMHVFITGGAGFIGSHIAESLLISGYRVTILDNLSSGVHGNVPNHPRITFIEKDLLSYAAAEWPRDLDAVIHLAALPSVTESWIELRRVHEINLSGTVHVLEGARHNHVPRFVFASSAAVYGDATSLPLREDARTEPLSPYGLQKLAGEQYGRMIARESDLKFIALRFFNVYGTRQPASSPYFRCDFALHPGDEFRPGNHSSRRRIANPGFCLREGCSACSCCRAAFAES
jgi:NAD dependent epimerase/dehydratase family/Transposase